MAHSVNSKLSRSGALWKCHKRISPFCQYMTSCNKQQAASSSQSLQLGDSLGRCRKAEAVCLGAGSWEDGQLAISQKNQEEKRGAMAKWNIYGNGQGTSERTGPGEEFRNEECVAVQIEISTAMCHTDAATTNVQRKTPSNCEQQFYLWAKSAKQNYGHLAERFWDEAIGQ